MLLLGGANMKENKFETILEQIAKKKTPPQRMFAGKCK